MNARYSLGFRGGLCALGLLIGAIPGVIAECSAPRHAPSPWALLVTPLRHEHFSIMTILLILGCVSAMLWNGKLLLVGISHSIVIGWLWVQWASAVIYIGV